MRTILVLCVFLLMDAPASFASKKKTVPPAPIPQAIVEAKKIFLANAGGNQLAFDEFYSQVKTWARYEIVGSPADADIVMELKYFVVDEGTRVSSYTNSYTGQTQVLSHHRTDPELQLNVYGAKSKDLLWSVTDHRRLARFEKNIEKESVNSADRLAEGLKERVSASTTVRQP